MIQATDVINVYGVLSQPGSLTSADIMRLYCCSRSAAIKKMHDVQNHFAAQGYYVNPRHITRSQLCEFEGWSWDDISRNALDLIRVRSSNG